MISRQCPHCASREIVRVPVMQAPVNSAYLLLMGWYSVILPSAFPSRFRCEGCARVFRRYTVLGWFYLALLIGLVVGQIVLYLVFVARYALRS